MRLKYVIRGLIKFFSPFIYKILKNNNTGGTNEVLYCYSVWLRHIVMLNEYGTNILPKKVVLKPN